VAIHDLISGAASSTCAVPGPGDVSWISSSGIRGTRRDHRGRAGGNAQPGFIGDRQLDPLDIHLRHRRKLSRGKQGRDNA
jgi:hypothetical protein